MSIISLHIKREGGGGIDTRRVEDRVSGKRETAFTGKFTSKCNDNFAMYM